MKKARLAAESLADRLDLPQDALLGSGKLTVAAGRQVFIENHCGILEYGTERICVAFDRGRGRYKRGGAGACGDERERAYHKGKASFAGMGVT